MKYDRIANTVEILRMALAETQKHDEDSSPIGVIFDNLHNRVTEAQTEINRDLKAVTRDYDAPVRVENVRMEKGY